MNATVAGVVEGGPIYAEVRRFYGKNNSCWFNYADLGILIMYNGLGVGALAGAGGGYRFAISRRTRLDVFAGYEFNRAKYMKGSGIDDEVGAWSMKAYESLHKVTIGVAFVF